MKSDRLGKYSHYISDELNKYCLGVQETLTTQINEVIDKELSKCNGHPSEHEVKLFAHSLKKHITKLKLL